VGQQVVFVANSTNTGATTASVNAVGARSVRKNGSIPLSPGDIIAGAVYTLFFDGLAWQLSGGVGGGQIMTRTPFTATAGQTAFTASYVPGAIFIVQNGVLLDSNKYVATNGTSFTLNAGATAGQLIELISFKPFSVADTYTKAEADMRFLPVAQAKVLAPSGEVAYFAMEAAPSGWIKANGAVINRTTYADLFLAIGTRFGAGDGATTFRLPDLRGEFVRGWDDGRNVDAGRALGSTQAATTVQNSLEASFGTTSIPMTNVDATSDGPSGAVGQVSFTGTSPRTINSMRPRNVALLACIKI
jgi:microcystin-dependent protein